MRTVDVFFYGLYMDRELLENKGARPADVRPALIRDYVLRIGARAAVVPERGRVVHGLLMKLTHADLELLYAEPGVRMYRPEPVLAVIGSGEAMPALCYNLPEAPRSEERDEEYVAKLRALGERLGLPGEYVREMGSEN